MVFKTWKVPQTPQVSKYTNCQDVTYALVQLSTAQKVVGAFVLGQVVQGLNLAAAESGGYVYDLIVDLNGCDLGHYLGDVC